MNHSRTFRNWSRSVCSLAFICLAPFATAESRLDTTARERGVALAARTFGVLSSNLMTAFSQGGVSNALQFCSTAAQPLTASVADTNQIVIRRISHKARNPKNRAGAAELAILDEFRATLAAGRPVAPLVQTNAPGGATFFAPIVLNNPLCLNCHGQSGPEIKPEHQEIIRQLYPEDQATGFKLGELRGLWRIDFQPAALSGMTPHAP